MAKRYASDVWEQIRSEYRSGALSVRALAEKHGPTEAAIRARAKQERWERDLSDDVRAATRAKLAKGDPTSSASPIEIIEAASTRNFEAVQGHLKRLGKLAELEDKIMAKIEQSFADYDKVAEAEMISDRVEAALSEDKPAVRAMRMATLLRPEEMRSGLLKNITRNYADLTAAAAKRITLERQALNLDKPEEVDKGEGGFLFEAFLAGERDASGAAHG